MRSAGTIGILPLLVLIGCGPDTGPPATEGGVASAATTEELAQLISAGGVERIELSGDRYRVADLELSGTGVILVGRGARTTVLEGPLSVTACSSCGLEALTVIAGTRSSAILDVRRSALTLRDVRVGEASDLSETGIVAEGVQLQLERVWLQTGGTGVRASNGGSLTVRHSIFQDLSDAIEVAADTEVTLVDNLFAEIDRCIVRGNASPATAPSLNAMFGNVRVPGPESTTPDASCQETVLLGPTDSDAAPVLLELRRSEALVDSPVLSLSGPR